MFVQSLRQPCRDRQMAAESSRRGFTLLEVILAVSLSAVLLVALYSALRLHLRYAQVGPDRVRRTQLARAILDRIARDVRAVVPEGDAEPSDSYSSASSSTSGTSSSSGTTGSSTSGTSDPASTPSTSEPDAYVEAFGIFGGSDWIQIYTANHHSNVDDAELMSISGSMAQAMTLRRVSYSLSYLTTLPDRNGRTQRVGLARSEVASIGAPLIDSGSNDNDYRATTDFLCDDLAEIKFEYWDDLTEWWVESWGFEGPIAPPRAIRVTISLMVPDEYLETQLGMSGGQSTWQPNYQLVIPIATWDPESSDYSDTGVTP